MLRSKRRATISLSSPIFRNHETHDNSHGSRAFSCGPRLPDDGVLPDAAVGPPLAVGRDRTSVAVTLPSSSEPRHPLAESSFVSFPPFIHSPSSPLSPEADNDDSKDQHDGKPGIQVNVSTKERSTVPAMAADSASRLAHSGSLHDGAAPTERTALLSGTPSGVLARDGHDAVGATAVDDGGRCVEAAGDGDVTAGANEEVVVGGGAGTFLRNLGTVEAFAIVVSIVIGSGVFTSPGSIDTNVPSPGAALLVWLVGGVLAWTGASTMAELGTAIPGEGTYTSSMKGWGGTKGGCC